jgi:putative aldouronate transport system permease protein
MQRPTTKPPRRKFNWKRDFRLNWTMYLLFTPVLSYFIIFNYLPMFGIVIAFEDYRPTRGFFGSEWVGFDNFLEFFTNPTFFNVLRNTVVISVLGLVVGLITAVSFTLLLNEIKFNKFKKPVQTISYLPYFISATVIAGMIIDFCSSNGIVTNFLVAVFGIKRENLLMNPNYFWMINLVSGLWQGLGYSSIIYISALGNVSQELHEAAAIDGANRLRRVWHITLPALKPTIITMLILNMGMILSVGSDKILLIYNSTIYSTADVISSHVYRMGVERMQFGYSAAVGLFQSVIGTVLLLTTNFISRKVADSSIF